MSDINYFEQNIIVFRKFSQLFLFIIKGQILCKFFI